MPRKSRGSAPTTDDKVKQALAGLASKRWTTVHAAAKGVGMSKNEKDSRASLEGEVTRRSTRRTAKVDQGRGKGSSEVDYSFDGYGTSSKTRLYQRYG